MLETAGKGAGVVKTNAPGELVLETTGGLVGGLCVVLRGNLAGLLAILSCPDNCGGGFLGLGGLAPLTICTGLVLMMLLSWNPGLLVNTTGFLDLTGNSSGARVGKGFKVC